MTSMMALSAPFGVTTTRPGMRYAGRPKMQRAYEGLKGRLTRIQVGPFGVDPLKVGPFQVFPEGVADEFASGLVDGVVGAIQSEDAQKAVQAAVKPWVIAAIVLGGIGAVAGVGGAVIAMTRRG
jgi:hypothetical protein